MKMKRGARALILVMDIKKICLKSKRSLSTVVASLLMVLLVVLAVAIISQIIIPMIKEDLGTAGSCLDAIGDVKINQDYTCYSEIDGAYTVSVSVAVKKIEVDGFIFNVYAEGNAESETITTNLPEEGEARAYTLNRLNFKPETIGVSLIIGGDTCDEVDTLVISKCSQG